MPTPIYDTGDPGNVVGTPPPPAGSSGGEGGSPPPPGGSGPQKHPVQPKKAHRAGGAPASGLRQDYRASAFGAPAKAHPTGLLTAHTRAKVVALPLHSSSGLSPAVQRREASVSSKPAHPLLAARERFAMKYFTSRGLTRAQAAGVVGNLVVESGNYLNPAEPGGGIGQWTGSRLQRMVAFEGGRPNFKRQVEFVWNELTRDPVYGLSNLRRAQTPAQAAVIVTQLYEIPDRRYAHEQRRILDAERVYRGDYGSPA